MSDHVLEERVRAGREVGRVGESEDVLDLAGGESLTLSKTGIEQMLSELCEEMKTT